MSLALAHVLFGGIDEGRLRTLHITQSCAAGDQLVCAATRWCIANGAIEHEAGVVQTKERHHVVLVYAVPGNANAPDQTVAAIDRDAAGKDLDTARDSRQPSTVGAVLVNKPLDAANDTMLCKRIINYGNRIADFPNQRSIHAGGVLISDLPIFHYTALDLPPKDFAVTQFDMYVAESIGFEKLDILSQRGIGHIQDSVKIIEQNRKVRVDVHDVKTFKTDEKVNAQLRKDDAIGCFYVESPAMRGLLKKLSCGDYITLVAASSIIRPGVGKSGMMRAYIQRFHKPDSVVYLHPVMEELLKETYGVMVYTPHAVVGG